MTPTDIRPLTAAEAAAELGVTPDRIHQLYEAGLLVGEKVTARERARLYIFRWSVAAKKREWAGEQA